MKNTIRSFISGMKVTFMPVFIISMLSIIAQWAAWQIGYIPICIVYIPMAIAWFFWIKRRAEKYVSALITSMSEEELMDMKG